MKELTGIDAIKTCLASFKNAMNNSLALLINVAICVFSKAELIAKAAFLISNIRMLFDNYQIVVLDDLSLGLDESLSAGISLADAVQQVAKVLVDEGGAVVGQCLQGWSESVVPQELAAQYGQIDGLRNTLNGVVHSVDRSVDAVCDGAKQVAQQ